MTNERAFVIDCRSGRDRKGEKKDKMWKQSLGKVSPFTRSKHRDDPTVSLDHSDCLPDCGL